MYFITQKYNFMLKKIIEKIRLTRLFSIPNANEFAHRRHDLDWLRVLAFGLLILFHSGMFYAENWGFHAKSNYRSQSLESVMLLISPWRMPILWIITGIAIKFIMAKVSLTRFIYQRSLRILIPLLFGILVVVPPQLYVEMSQNNDLNLKFWPFMQEFYTPNSNVFTKYSSGIWPHIDVNHLWFLRSLWSYSLIIVLLMPLLNTGVMHRLTEKLYNQSLLILIPTFTLPFFIIELTVSNEQSRYAIGFTCMLYGYLIGWSPTFWGKVSQYRSSLLIALVINFIIIVTFYNMVWLHPINQPQWLNVLGSLSYSLMRVVGVFTCFGFAYHYLNRPSKTLTYLNDAVYSFYILHQTFIIVIGYNLIDYSLGPIIEPLLLISLTTLSCFMCFEVIRRIDILRPLFGLRMLKSYPLLMQLIGKSLALLAMLVIGLEILI